MEQSGSALPMIFFMATFLFAMAGVWRTFVKAGRPGWACLVPIYNVIVLLQIAGRPMWWFILLLIPFVNFFVVLVLMMDIAKSFGRGMGFGLGLMFLGFVFYPILGFGEAQYAGAPAR
jgi:hypothetical protein